MSNHQVEKKGMMEKPSTPLPPSPSPSKQLERQLSIEEPKTLHHGELDLARGLVPITISEEAKVDIVVSEWDEELD
ncbi:unnamed protein product [Lupinus luteus]|uniref:Uncharacterized protein n=1 Tax=Lupinus luteus TaxID=3873 RepID=A0AAV1W829_LUPLU